MPQDAAERRTAAETVELRLRLPAEVAAYYEERAQARFLRLPAYLRILLSDQYRRERGKGDSRT